MCLVCGADEEGESHFGGISCRACAAFFRRYYHSKRVANRCTCKDRTIKSHPCRKCRLEKCLSIGMTPKKVQGSRDKNADELLQMIPSCSKKSLLTARIIPKDTSNISFAIPNWKEFENRRHELTGGRMFEMNVYELTCITKMDIELTWNMVSTMFPFTRALQEKDKAALLRNFHMKFWVLFPLLDGIENSEDFDTMEEDEYEKMIVSFYDGAFVKGKELSNKEIMRIFEPFWWTFFSKTAPPIIGLNLQKEEVMAIVCLIFFDYGYTNISPECQEMCRNVRKVIFRELKNYQNSRGFDEMRFFETVESLETIERGEQKFMEEMMICEMYNVRIHDDFKQILRETKY